MIAASFDFVSVIGNRILVGTIELQCTEAGSNIAIVAADDLGFDPYRDGFVADCESISQFPIEAIATIYQLCSTDADCDDDNACTEEYCDEGTDRCVYSKLPDDTPCDDGVTCNDPDICVDGQCVFQGEPCCEITIDPKTAEAYYGETIQFTVSEKGDCNPTTPCYTWEVLASGGTGNTTERYSWAAAAAAGTDNTAGGGVIDANGLYTAGDSVGTDIVRVTDGCSNGAPYDEAEVTVTGPPPTTTTTSVRPTTTTTSIETECDEDIDCTDELFCNGAETCVGGICQDGTPVACTDDGQFCNGTESCSEQADACVSSGNPCGTTQSCNETTDACEQLARIDSLLPPSWYQSRWIPLIRHLRIVGSGTSFQARESKVTFEPNIAVFPFFSRVVDEENILIWTYIMPQWLTRPLEGPVQVTVTTGSEVVSADWDINLLPFPLDQEGADLE